MSLYEHRDYKCFVLARIHSSPNGGRGIRRRLAVKIGCQVAYVSHVLAGDKHFSQEQAEACARFFHLNEQETEYFLLLVDWARAGTQELRSLRARQIKERRASALEIKDRLQIHTEINDADKATYYSSWHYQAVRSLLMIKEFNTSKKIADRLGLSVQRIEEILQFLIAKGMVARSSQGLSVTQKQIHLPRSSPLVSKLHANWRIRTLHSLEQIRLDDYHYSGLITVSRADAEKIREILVKSLAAAVDTARPSPEEALYVLAMDFFEL